MSNALPEFTVGQIHPIECVREGWQLIKSQYWMMFGITVVGILVASLAPMNILLGAVTCSIYYCLMRLERGKPVEFGMVIKGFDTFLQSLIVTLFVTVPMLLIMIPAYAAIFITMFSVMPKQKGAQMSSGDVTLLASVIIICAVVVLVVAFVVQMLAFFGYALVVDRKLTGMDAIRTSIRAARKNWVGVLLLMLLTGLMMFAGLLACYVGALFVIPLHYAANFAAYRRVFPRPEIQSLGEDARDYAEPPPRLPNQSD